MLLIQGAALRLFRCYKNRHFVCEVPGEGGEKKKADTVFGANTGCQWHRGWHQTLFVSLLNACDSLVGIRIAVGTLESFWQSLNESCVLVCCSKAWLIEKPSLSSPLPAPQRLKKRLGQIKEKSFKNGLHVPKDIKDAQWFLGRWHLFPILSLLLRSSKQSKKTEGEASKPCAVHLPGTYRPIHYRGCYDKCVGDRLSVVMCERTHYNCLLLSFSSPLVSDSISSSLSL